MAGFPVRLIGTANKLGAARKLEVRCPTARRGLSTGANSHQEDRWVYWKLFFLSGAVTLATIESLKVYFDTESPTHKLLGNMLLEAKSKLFWQSRHSGSSPSGGAKDM